MHEQKWEFNKEIEITKIINFLFEKHNCTTELNPELQMQNLPCRRTSDPEDRTFKIIQTEESEENP